MQPDDFNLQALYDNQSKGGRTGLPHVMRLVRWLRHPAGSFTRIAPW